MRKTIWSGLIVAVLLALVLTACAGDSGGSTQRQSPPADYASTTNPFAGQADAVAEGQVLYTTNCATCHGETADGSGAAGAALDPKPANLQQTSKETEPVYQHWVISEGCAAAGLSTSMVAYKGILSDDDIWKIVTYLEGTYGQ